MVKIYERYHFLNSASTTLSVNVEFYHHTWSILHNTMFLISSQGNIRSCSSPLKNSDARKGNSHKVGLKYAKSCTDFWESGTSGSPSTMSSPPQGLCGSILTCSSAVWHRQLHYTRDTSDWQMRGNKLLLLCANNTATMSLKIITCDITAYCSSSEGVRDDSNMLLAWVHCQNVAAYHRSCPWSVSIDTIHYANRSVWHV